MVIHVGDCSPWARSRSVNARAGPLIFMATEAGSAEKESVTCAGVVVEGDGALSLISCPLVPV